MQIFIHRPEGKLGPYSLEQLQAQLAAGTVRPDELAWHEGLSEWKPVASLLTPALPTPPVFVPPAAAKPPKPPSGAYTRPNTFYHQTATCSVWILLFPIVIQFIEAPVVHASVTVGDPNGAAWIRLFFAAVIALAMLTGVVLGIVALFGISKYGTRGILVKSLFGIIVPLLLILISIPVMRSAQERAARIRAAQETGSAPGN